MSSAARPCWRCSSDRGLSMRTSYGERASQSSAERPGRAEAEDLLPAEPADGGQPVLRLRGADQDRRGRHLDGGNFSADQGGAGVHSAGLHLRPVRRPGGAHGRGGEPVRARVRFAGGPDLVRGGAGLPGASRGAEGRVRGAPGVGLVHRLDLPALRRVSAGAVQLPVGHAPRAARRSSWAFRFPRRRAWWPR